MFMDHREVVCDTYIWTEIETDFQGMTLIGKLEQFSHAYQSSPNLINLKNLIKKKQTLFMDQRGRLYVIHTYEQKLIWTDFQGMTTLICKLELFSGDAYQSSPNLKIRKI